MGHALLAFVHAGPRFTGTVKTCCIRAGGPPFRIWRKGPQIKIKRRSTFDLFKEVPRRQVGHKRAVCETETDVRATNRNEPIRIMEPGGVHKLNTKGIYTDTRMETLPHQTTCGRNGLWPFIRIWDAGGAKLSSYARTISTTHEKYRTMCEDDLRNGRFTIS